jgi:hypothetical protein
VIVTGEYEIDDHSEHNHMKLSGDQIVSSKSKTWKLHRELARFTDDLTSLG